MIFQTSLKYRPTYLEVFSSRFLSDYHQYLLHQFWLWRQNFLEVTWTNVSIDKLDAGVHVIRKSLYWWKLLTNLKVVLIHYVITSVSCNANPIVLLTIGTNSSYLFNWVGYWILKLCLCFVISFRLRTFCFLTNLISESEQFWLCVIFNQLFTIVGSLSDRCGSSLFSNTTLSQSFL